MSNLVRSSFKALAPVFAGFFLGAVMCLMICLLNGCHTQKSSVTSVVVDSTAMLSSTEIGISNSESSAYKNLSLRFDSLEMWIAPQLPSLYNAEATGDTSVALSSFNCSMPGNYLPYPLYLKAAGATLSGEEGSHKRQENIVAKKDTVYLNVKSNEKSKNDVDRTAVAKPPDINWTFIICFVVFCASIIFFFKKK